MDVVHLATIRSTKNYLNNLKYFIFILNIKVENIGVYLINELIEDLLIEQSMTM